MKDTHGRGWEQSDLPSHLQSGLIRDEPAWAVPATCVADPSSPAHDPRAPYVRLAVVGLVQRKGEGQRQGEGCRPGPEGRNSDADDSRWLLLHRVQPFAAWDPPGGRMETGEDLAAAVKREVQEETGLEIEVAGPCYAFLTFYKGERLLAVSMACRPSGDPDAIRLEPGGAEGWRWATAREWEELAAKGLSSWAPMDVRKVTKAVAALWEAERG